MILSINILKLIVYNQFKYIHIMKEPIITCNHVVHSYIENIPLFTYRVVFESGPTIGLRMTKYAFNVLCAELGWKLTPSIIN